MNAKLAVLVWAALLVWLVRSRKEVHVDIGEVTVVDWYPW